MLYFIFYNHLPLEDLIQNVRTLPSFYVNSQWILEPSLDLQVVIKSNRHTILTFIMDIFRITSKIIAFKYYCRQKREVVNQEWKKTASPS